MNNVVIITGSSGGIGKALVQTYQEDNFFVIGIDKVQSNNSALNFFGIETDLDDFVKDIKSRESLIAQIREMLPKDINEFILINNAAVQILKPIEQIDYIHMNESITINSLAPFFMAQSLQKELSEHMGHIINISSIHSNQTKSSFACYAMSKAALESITRSLAIEMSPHGVSVNAIAPAAILTDMLKDGFNNNNKKINELESYHPSNKIGSPEELALFIKSISQHKGRFLTGSIIDFNGGIASKLNDPNNFS